MTHFYYLLLFCICLLHSGYFQQQIITESTVNKEFNNVYSGSYRIINITKIRTLVLHLPSNFTYFAIKAERKMTKSNESKILFYESKHPILRNLRDSYFQMKVETKDYFFRTRRHGFNWLLVQLDIPFHKSSGDLLNLTLTAAKAPNQDGSCSKDTFKCTLSSELCLTNVALYDTHRNCDNGQDEEPITKYTNVSSGFYNFTFGSRSALYVFQLPRNFTFFFIKTQVKMANKSKIHIMESSVPYIYPGNGKHHTLISYNESSFVSNITSRTTQVGWYLLVFFNTTYYFRSGEDLLNLTLTAASDEKKELNKIVLITTVLSIATISGICVAILFCVRRRCRQRQRWKTDRAPSVPGSPNITTVVTISPRQEITLTQQCENWLAAISPGRIPLSNFRCYVEDLQSDRLLEEFQKMIAESTTVVPLCQRTTAVAANPINAVKNKRSDIFPYDQTRVVLQYSGRTRDLDKSYINASFVDGPYRLKEYIAAQGPTTSTVSDFWRMIWEQDVNLIVMLTKTTEATGLQCQKYWPDRYEVTADYNFKGTKMSITLNSVTAFPNNVIRNFHVKVKDVNRCICQIQYLDWEGNSTPDPAEFNVFMKQYDEMKTESLAGPVLVHCSTGVGRTGTFICIDHLMSQIKSGNEDIDVFATVLRLAAYRPKMLQTQTEYLFVYKFIDEFLLQRNSESYYSTIDHNEYDNFED